LNICNPDFVFGIYVLQTYGTSSFAYILHLVLTLVYLGWSTAYSDLADGYGLLKLGGSDYHGRGGHGESELGSVNLPVFAAHDFLKVARLIWCRAIWDNLERYAEEPSNSNLAKITRFGRTLIFKGGSPLSCGKDSIDRCLPLWLTNEERQNAEFDAIRLKLSNIFISQGGLQVPIESK
jgi:hypothetical protein